jgi:hypothetical protein
MFSFNSSKLISHATQGRVDGDEIWSLSLVTKAVTRELRGREFRCRTHFHHIYVAEGKFPARI